MTDIDSLYPEHLTTMMGRIEQALGQEGHSGLLVASGSLKTAFLDDMTYPFKVNPHFKALAPVTDAPDSFMLIRPGDKPRLFHLQPRDYWHLPPATPSGAWTNEWEITPIGSPADMHNALGETKGLAYVGEETAFAEANGITNVNPTSLLSALHFDRAYKTRYEIACIRAANERAARGHSAAERAFRSGASEFEIQQAYLAATREREQQTPYSNIVALNEHCAVLHYQYYDLEPPALSRSMLIDAGAGYNGYAADVTRTYAADAGEFADLVTRMDADQRGIIDEIKPGMNYADLHRRMHERVAHILVDSGISTLSAEELVDTNATFTFLPHGLGHLIGLQTHDVAGFQQDREGATRAAPEQYPALRLTRPIEENQVFTIEPGLYFIPMLLEELKASPQGAGFDWARIESLLPFGGIRIEDNVAVTADGAINLTREAFASA